MGRVARRRAAKLAGIGVPAPQIGAGPLADEGLAQARDLVRAGSYAEARDALVATIERRPDCVEAYVQLSALLLRAGFPAESAVCRQQAEALSPHSAEGRVILGTAFAAEGMHEAAAQSYREALDQRPDDAAAWNNLGLSLASAGKLEQAAAAYRRAAQLDPDLPQPHANLAEALRARNDLQGAMESFQRAVHLEPDWAEAWNNLGVVTRGLGLTAQAMTAFRRAVKLRPDYAEAHLNLGNAYNSIYRTDEARGCYREALRVRPAYAEALFNLASQEQRPRAAAELCARALDARPDYPAARAGLVAAMLRGCLWDGLDALVAQIHEDVASRPDAEIAPMQFLQISHDPALQLLCGRNWTEQRVLSVARRFAPLPPPDWGPRPRLRVGYLSGDFRNHAVGHLVEELFEAHDRRSFEVFGYHTGPDDGSSVGRRIQAGMDHFADVADLPLPQLARRMRADGIDILVDLSGYTEHSRTEVLALRPAAVQVSYLGFPGSMGAGFIDYIIGDAYLTPPAMQSCYAERLALLPRCYQVSPARAPSAPVPTRADQGLPEKAVVFCCFNNTYKILPAMFDIWMRLLQQVPGAVLWLARSNAECEQALRLEASSRSVDPARLKFAALVDLEAHLARLSLADVFLDTAPYTAGATGSLTLRAGVPLVTLAGHTYAGRMAASLLHALELPQLVASDVVQYEAIALRLAGDVGRRAALRRHIAQGMPQLFDVPRFARELEQLFQEMWARGPGGQSVLAPI